MDTIYYFFFVFDIYIYIYNIEQLHLIYTEKKNILPVGYVLFEFLYIPKLTLYIGVRTLYRLRYRELEILDVSLIMSILYTVAHN